MTARAGSAPGCVVGLGIGQPIPRGQGTDMGLSIAQVQASRSFSLGAEVGSGRKDGRIGRSVSHGGGYDVGDGVGEEAYLTVGIGSPTLIHDHGRISPLANLTPFGPTRKDLLASLAQAQAGSRRQSIVSHARDQGEEDDGVEPLLRQPTHEPESLKIYPDSPTMPHSPVAPLGEFGRLEGVDGGHDVSQEKHVGWKNGSWSSVGSTQGLGQGHGDYDHLRYFRAVMG